jgi:cytochrome c-type biogenesis protein CcmH
VSIALDPALAAQTPPEATVFVYAKAVSGPPMPLAAQRIRVAELPVTLTLDDTMAMMPQMRLSAFPQVTVGARISRTGQAMPQPGDLEGEVSPVASNQAETVAVTIARVRP